MADPWYVNDWFSIGPFTKNDEDRKAAEADLARKRAALKERNVRMQAGDIRNAQPTQADPWIVNNMMSVGPITTNEAERAAAAASTARQRQAQHEAAVRARAGDVRNQPPAVPNPPAQGPGGIAALMMSENGVNPSPMISRDVQGPPIPAAPGMQGPPMPAQLPGGIADTMMGPDGGVNPSPLVAGMQNLGPWFKENMPLMYGLFTGQPNPNGTPAQAGLPPMTDPALPANAPVPGARPAIETVPVGPVTNAQPASTGYNPIDELMRVLAAPPAANPAQDKADAYAEREHNRTALLAQLAFASGLTKAGGAGWEEIGQGFAGAAAAYGSGFKRYADALQSSAERYADRSEKQAGRDLAIAKTKVEIKTAADERARKTWEDRMAGIDKMFEKEADAAKDSMGETDVADVMKRWQKAREMGEYIPPIIMSVKDN